ncbi:hypothetical protein ACIGEZ_05240 [Streptomyces sp. NPDC085481]|uniref:hypothetical protein n=1 Tax=Streptomyces sp. NPDC085481 TaxID=3365727 RepID=UPI0037D06E77
MVERIHMAATMRYVRHDSAAVRNARPGSPPAVPYARPGSPPAVPYARPGSLPAAVP